jgi:DNA-directed RNA polymerase subunit RPC12/RpoP
MSFENCRWSFEGEYWKTDCDNAHQFEVDGPDENGYNYCPYCGKRIEVEKEQAE